MMDRLKHHQSPAKSVKFRYGFATTESFQVVLTTQFNTRNDPPGNRPGIGGGYEFGSNKISKQFPRIFRTNGKRSEVRVVGLSTQRNRRASQPDID